MGHPYYPAGIPRFNHVAMSVPADVLDEASRKELCVFFDEVLGFTEMAEMTLDRQRLIFSCVHWDQFIFLIADDAPMTAPRLDHFGMSVGSLEDLLAVAERAKAFGEKDKRLDFIDHKCDDQGTIQIHSIYVKFLLPMMCEMQYWEFVDQKVADMNRQANTEKQG